MEKFEGKFLCMATYHPKPGSEKEFLNLWNNGICKLAKKMGCVAISLYEDEETHEFIATGHWATREDAMLFLESAETKKLTEEANSYLLVPPTREVFAVLKEVA